MSSVAQKYVFSSTEICLQPAQKYAFIQNTKRLQSVHKHVLSLYQNIYLTHVSPIMTYIVLLISDTFLSTASSPSAPRAWRSSGGQHYDNTTLSPACMNGKLIYKVGWKHLIVCSTVCDRLTSAATAPLQFIECSALICYSQSVSAVRTAGVMVHKLV